MSDHKVVDKRGNHEEKSRPKVVLPPLRAFRVKQYKAIEGEIVYAHRMTFEDGGLLVFERFLEVADGEYGIQIPRTFKTWEDAEEILATNGVQH